MPSFNDFINYALSIVNDSNYGYSMDFRYNQAVTYSEALNWDNTIPSGAYAWNYHYDFTNFAGTGATIHYMDCSSYVSYCLQAAGFNNSVFDTASAKSVLLSLGWRQLDNGNNLQQGDIGLKRTDQSGHIEICYKGGVAGSTAVFMGAHGRRGETSQPPYDLPNQISIGWTNGDTDYHYDSFTMFFRYDDWSDEEPIPEPVVENKSLYIVSAIAGNWSQESTLSPTIWERLNPRSWDNIWESGVGSGYGLGGWTNVQYSDGTVSWNLLNMYNWITEQGMSVASGDAQVSYFLSQDTHWNYSSSMYEVDKIKYTNWSDWWNSDITDLYQLTYDFFRCWEGIHDGTENIRYEYAQMCYDYILEHYDDESITDWIDGNYYHNDDEIKHNAVMLWRAIQREIGATGSASYPWNGNTGSNAGDHGETTSKEEAISWENFLLSGLGRNSGENNTPIHIIKRRRF